MQLTRIGHAAAAAALAAAACASPAAAFVPADEQNAGTVLRLFTDSDKVAVRSYVGSYALALQNDWALDLEWMNERVVIPAIDAPAGSQQAVDAITTASRPISGNAFQEFVKVRNEFQTGLRKGGVSLGYYLSTESDYLGQQLAAGYNRDFMNQQLNLAVGSSFGWDAIDPLADDDTQGGRDSKTTLHWNAVATQVLTSTTVLRYGLEYNWVQGLQHNPYRNVYAGGTNVPERHPDDRQRRDAFVKLNQYVGNRSSMRLHYRYYADDWGVDSHEIGSMLSQYVTEGVFASFHHRYYRQSSADFYREEYATAAGIDGYRTGDYRLSDLSSHLFGIGLDFSLYGVAAHSPFWSGMAVRVDYERYFNSNNYSAGFFTTGLNYRF